MIEYHSIQNILDLCKEQDKKIWEVVLQADMDESGASGEQVFEKMRFMYRAMQEADQSYEANLKSQSGMVGGDGEKMRQYNATGKNLCSEYSSLFIQAFDSPIFNAFSIARLEYSLHKFFPVAL